MTDDPLNGPTNQQRIAAEAIERTHRAAADPLIQNYEFCKAMKEAHASRQIINEHFFRRLVVETLGVPENEITPEQWFNARYKLMKQYGAVEFIPDEGALTNVAALQPLRANTVVAAEGDFGALARQMDASVRQMAGQPVGGVKAERTESTGGNAVSAQPAIVTNGGKSTGRRAKIDAFISKLNEAGRKITRKDIWTVAGYKDRTEFERFQRGDTRTTRSGATTFNRVLGMAPEDFIRALENKKKTST